MGDTYRAEQAGAMGPNAHAENMTFNQVWNQNSSKIDLPQLASELAALRSEMLKEAKEPEDYAKSAPSHLLKPQPNKMMDPKALEFLSKAGTWALDVATKIRVTIAAAALKESMGIK